MQARKQQSNIFNQLKEKFANLKFYRSKTVFKNQRQNNDFWDIQKLKESITSKLEDKKW